MIETCSLVLSAKNIGHTLEKDEMGTTHIIVSAGAFEQAHYQLDTFFEENKNWPPQQYIPEHSAVPALLPTILSMGAMAFFYLITGPWSQHSTWFMMGANDASAVIKDGEWYRLITALTLHAEISHLAGNCLIGAFLIYFFLQIHGTGIGLLAILLSGTTGNLANTLAHGQDHLSVGFSTAVFCLIGMLSIYQIIEQRQPFGIRMFVPFMAGAALLAMLGSSGARTDLGSHLFGLLAGMATGFILALPVIKKLRKSTFAQTCCLLATIIILLTAWNSALAPPVH